MTIRGIFTGLILTISFSALGHGVTLAEKPIADFITARKVTINEETLKCVYFGDSLTDETSRSMHLTVNRGFGQKLIKSTTIYTNPNTVNNQKPDREKDQCKLVKQILKKAKKNNGELELNFNIKINHTLSLAWSVNCYINTTITETFEIGGYSFYSKVVNDLITLKQLERGDRNTLSNEELVEHLHSGCLEEAKKKGLIFTEVEHD